jgi:predicted flap endonuclease-1-like 5' DNA nuclease
MPEITVIHIGLATLAAIIGVVAGSIMRGKRCAQEKIAVNTGWQEQLEAQRSEHERLLGQNKSLMEQVNQYQASGKDATNRAKELSGALKEAFGKRDEFQREIKDVRNTLASAVRERDKLQADMASKSANDDSLDTTLQEKDDKIFKLSRELENWQDRLPPLIERYQTRNAEAEALETELEAARERIQELELTLESGQTRVESVDSASMSDDMDASNDSDEVEAEAADQTDDQADLGSDDETHIEEHSFESEPSNDSALNDSDTSNPRDDLKQIKGIGPAIEKTLHELGIFRFDQVAEMNEYDIDRIAKRLKGFRTRIYREDWIGQARTLQDQQASEQA